jgi:hypothetical protein
MKRILGSIVVVSFVFGTAAFAGPGQWSSHNPSAIAVQKAKKPSKKHAKKAGKKAKKKAAEHHDEHAAPSEGSDMPAAPAGTAEAH